MNDKQISTEQYDIPRTDLPTSTHMKKSIKACLKKRQGPVGPVEMTSAQIKAFKREGIRVVFAAFCIHFVLGTYYLWGGVSVYVASYLKHYDSSVDIDTVKLVFPFMGLILNAGMPLGVKIAEKIGTKTICLIGILLIPLASLICSFITSLVPFIIIYSILIGFCSGVLYMLPVQAGWKYFPNRKGTISGIIIAGYGFGSLTFNLVSTALVNPDNERANVIIDGNRYFPKEIYEKVPSMFRILALMYLVIGVFGALLVKNPLVTPLNIAPTKQAATLEAQPNNIKYSITRPTDRVEETPAELPAEATIPEAVVITVPAVVANEGIRESKSLKECLKTKQYFLLFSIEACALFFGLLMANNYKVFGLTKINDDNFLTTVGSIGSAVNGCSRIFWATLMDKLGFKRVWFTMMLLQAILAATIMPISTSKPAYLIWYCLIMGCTGGQLSMIPTNTSRIFGVKRGSLVFGFVHFAFSLANFGSFFLTKFGIKTIGWTPIFWICFGLTLVSFALNFLLPERPRFK